MQRAIAAEIGSTQPKFVSVPAPESPGEGEVLCRTLQLGICGTDREILASAQPLLPEGEDFLVLCHECLARVEAVGEGVAELSPGQLVVPTVRRPIGASSIRVDMLSFGQCTERGIIRQHGFSQPLWVDRPAFLLPVDESLADVAVFIEPQAVAEKAANEAEILQRARLGDGVWAAQPPRVLVTGQGPIAFAALLAAVSRGWPVTMAGRDEGRTTRIDLAYALGARRYLPLQEVNVNSDNVERNGFDLLLECTGNDTVLLAASTALASRGVAVWLGASRAPRPVPHNVARLMREAVVRNHLHVGSVNAAPRDFADARRHLAELSRSRPVALPQLFTRRVSFGDSLEYFTNRGRQSIKVVIEY